MGIEKLAGDFNFLKGKLFLMQGCQLQHFKIPLVFLAALVLPMLLGEWLSYETKSVAYAISLAIKEILIFALPFVIFALVFGSLTKFGSKALRYVLIIIPLVCCSNFMNTMLVYLLSSGVTQFSLSMDPAVIESQQCLSPMFTIAIPSMVSNDMALISGSVLGLLIGRFFTTLATRIVISLEKLTKYFLKGLLPIMPLFIVGTSMKLQHDGTFISIYHQYLPILLVFVVSAYSYVFLQHLLLARCSFQKCAQYIRNIIPATITAFSSMSSAMALPLSLKAAEKNLDNKDNAGIIVPCVVNIHLVGDCFFIPLIAITVMISFGDAFPSFNNYIMFAVHFVLAKFAVAAVPGGGVLVMIPVMQKYLLMSSDMIAIVTALYILFDPLITTCNVAGNGAMAIVFDKITRGRNINSHYC
jgi:Na+/H+-dicarboxylate symporter